MVNAVAYAASQFRLTRLTAVGRAQVDLQPLAGRERAGPAGAVVAVDWRRTAGRRPATSVDDAVVGLPCETTTSAALGRSEVTTK